MKGFLTAAGILVLASCYNPTIHSVTASCGVTKLRVSDNSVAGILTDIPEGRTLLSTGNTQFVIATGAGEMVLVNSTEMAVDTSFTVGFAGGAGYRSMIMPSSQNIYLTSSAGDLLQIDISELSVANSFSAGQQPEVLAKLPYSGEFFYVSDGTSTRISEFRTLNNSIVRESEPLGSPPAALAAESFANSYLIAVTGDEAGLCGILNIGTFHFERVMMGYPCSDAAAFPAESIWAVTHPMWNAESGMVSICTNFSLPEIEPVAVSGHPMKICSVPGTTLFYLLSYKAGGESSVISINYLTGQVESETVISGFPWDITSHGNGEFILALTSELPEG